VVLVELLAAPIVTVGLVVKATLVSAAYSPPPPPAPPRVVLFLADPPPLLPMQAI
jgi:hypothetical protein